MFLYRRVCDFHCLEVSQGKVRTLNRLGGKLNHLLMHIQLVIFIPKNYWNQTTTVKVIIGGLVVYFLLPSVDEGMAIQLYCLSDCVLVHDRALQKRLLFVLTACAQTPSRLKPESNRVVYWLPPCLHFSSVQC